MRLKERKNIVTFLTTMMAEDQLVSKVSEMLQSHNKDILYNWGNLIINKQKKKSFISFSPYSGRNRHRIGEEKS